MSGKNSSLVSCVFCDPTRDLVKTGKSETNAWRATKPHKYDLSRRSTITQKSEGGNLGQFQRGVLVSEIFGITYSYTRLLNGRITSATQRREYTNLIGVSVTLVSRNKRL